MGFSGTMRETMAAGQAHPWVVTKLRSPELRDGVFARPRLSQILDGAVQAGEPLVLVSAPAGSGKSTAVAAWSSSRTDLSTVWMQVDEADNDPVRFWGALVAGLGVLDPRIQATVEPILKSPRVSFVDNALPALVNALDRLEDLVVVLDDYHLVDSAQIHDALANLIDACPRHVTLVVSTRHDPPLRLGRLRVRGQLREIRADELRFDRAEAAMILNTAVLSDAEIETLHERTEGWAAGLVLASISLARSADPTAFVANFAGDNRMIVDYFATELWDSLEEPVRQFFMDISVLDRMCGELVDALLDSDGQGAGWLETASRDNQLIISLDEQARWYRFHHLMQEQLQSRLRRDDPDRYLALHNKAAAWFEANDDPGAAIRHSIAANDMAAASRLVGRHGSATFNDGHLVTVRGWLETLGDTVVADDPWLAILQLWTVIIEGDWDNVDGPLRVAQERLDRDDLGPDAALLRGSLASAHSRAAVAKGEIDLALSLSQNAFEHPEQYGVSCLVSGMFGRCLMWRGRLDEAVEVLQDAQTAAQLQGEHLIASTAQICLAIIACAQNDPGRACHLAEAALAHAGEHEISDYHQLAPAYSVLGRTLAFAEPACAEQLGERGVELARRSHEPIELGYALISLAEIHVADQKTEAAERLLVEARHLLGRCKDPGMVLTFLARTEARLGGSPVSGSAVQPGVSPVDTLTARELTTLRLLPSELSIREIASELYVSHNTVKGHLKAVYRKLQVNDRQTAVQRARELELL